MLPLETGMIILYSNRKINHNMAEQTSEFNKFEAVKYRHEDQARLLQYITKMDLQFFSGFFYTTTCFRWFF